ncbi:MAG: ferritin-like domain-containing protein [Ferruginibacter sp.]
MKTAEKKTTQKSSASSTKSKTSASSKAQSNGNAAASGLRTLFQDSLKDIYWAEKALLKAIPKMVKNATAVELTSALTEHLEVTRGQVTRLEEVFAAIGTKPQAKKCAAMEGLIKESEEIMESTDEGPVRDAGIISAGQKVEHYEIATYGTLCAFAKILQENEAAGLLLETLNEEKEADEKLSEIAESSINISAAEEEE